jgi:hypothetical protein
MNIFRERIAHERFIESVSQKDFAPVGRAGRGKPIRLLNSVWAIRRKKIDGRPDNPPGKTATKSAQAGPEKQAVQAMWIGIYLVCYCAANAGQTIVVRMKHAEDFLYETRLKHDIIIQEQNQISAQNRSPEVSLLSGTGDGTVAILISARSSITQSIKQIFSMRIQ